jgi:hypothetical protein
MTTTLTALMIAGSAAAGPLVLTHVPSAQTKVAGESRPNILSPELGQEIIAQGSTRLENPDALTKFYGYDDNGLAIPLIGPSCIEANKTEPDENTYLVFSCPSKNPNCPQKIKGPDGGRDYGTHFLFQGHETGIAGYITRINLDVQSDADGDHRVTLLATKDVNGAPLPPYDGSFWNPFANKLLFSAELGNNGGIWQADPGFNWPPAVEDISVIGGNCALGRAGYEGIRVDGVGNIWLIEDTGGSRPSATPQARVANSFLYRFIPNNPADLKQGGQLQALQVKDTSGRPIVYDGTNARTAGMQAIHGCGTVLQTQWVNLSMSAPACDANAAAKAAGATPFKRPENGNFQPGTKFSVFFFDETGDTDLRTQAYPGYGGLGAVLKLTQPGGPAANTGTIEPFYIGDPEHTGFDNTAFLTGRDLVFVEDASDTVHGAAPAGRGTFDSAWKFDIAQNYCGTGLQPVRILAQGRDASATLDSKCSDLGTAPGPGASFPTNEGDNEITGLHVSYGDPTFDGLQGWHTPDPFHNKHWRVFYTQQHGDNTTYEVKWGSSVTP